MTFLKLETFPAVTNISWYQTRISCSCCCWPVLAKPPSYLLQDPTPQQSPGQHISAGTRFPQLFVLSQEAHCQKQHQELFSCPKGNLHLRKEGRCSCLATPQRSHSRKEIYHAGPHQSNLFQFTLTCTKGHCRQYSSHLSFHSLLLGSRVPWGPPNSLCRCAWQCPYAGHVLHGVLWQAISRCITGRAEKSFPEKTLFLGGNPSQQPH